MATQYTFYGRFQVDIAAADLKSRITIHGSESSDGVYEITLRDHSEFPTLIEGKAWSITIETSSPFLNENYQLAELFLYDTHSPIDGFVTLLQTVKQHIPVPGEVVTLKYIFRTSLRLVYLRETLKPRPPAEPLVFTYNPSETRVVEPKFGRTNQPHSQMMNQ